MPPTPLPQDSPELLIASEWAMNTTPGAVSDFIAPRRELMFSNTQVRVVNPASRLITPDTMRRSGGRAMVIDIIDGQPVIMEGHAIDSSTDEAVDDVDGNLADVGVILDEIRGLSRDITALNAALGAAGAGSASVWDANADPVILINTEIRSLMIASRSSGIAVLFGVGAMEKFAAHAKVRERCPGGVSWATHPALFLTGSPFQTCTVLQAASLGAVDPVFVLDDDVLIFARSPRPNRLDAGFAKTFWRPFASLDAERTYSSTDQRLRVASRDWLEKLVITNPAGIKRLNVTAS